MGICQIEFGAYGKRWTVEVRATRYADGNPALVVFDLVNREPWGKLSVNFPDIRLAPGEYFIRTWAENEALVAPLLETGFFIDTGRRVPCGFCEASIWKLKGGE